MRENPDYFDSQASAAASLRLDIYTIRNAKSAGCPAFRSGRVYRKELLSWLKADRPRPSARSIDEADDEIMVSATAWQNRRGVLFEVTAFLDNAYLDKQIDISEYARLINATVPFLIKIGKAWGAGIDAVGFRNNRRCIVGAYLRQNAENTGPRGLT